MKRKLIPHIILIFFYSALLLIVSKASADEDTEIQQAIEVYQERPWTLGLAAGYGQRSNPLVNSDDIPLYVVFDIAWFGDWFFFDNGDFGFTLYETDKVSFNLVAHVNNERGVFEWFNNSQLGVQFFPETSPSPESPDADDLLSLENDSDTIPETEIVTEPIKPPNRKFAVDGGLEIMYADAWGDLQLQILSDISMTHKGMEIWASYGYTWEYGSWRLTPSIGFNWKSSHLLDYYYGVRDSEVLDNRPAYKASSGFNRFVRLSLSYRITDNWGIVGVAEYEALSRSVRRSPIVNKDSINTFFIGVMYRF